jgi:hypothetical protein
MIRAGHCDVRSTWRNCHALQFRMGCYCAAKVARLEAIMATIPETDGTPLSRSREGRDDRDHDSRTDGAPRIWDVRGILFLRRCTTISPSSTD